MQLSENFKLSEFTDYSVVQLDPIIITNLTRLALALETIRTYFNDNQIIINSGYRDLRTILALAVFQIHNIYTV